MSSVCEWRAHVAFCGVLLCASALAATPARAAPEPARADAVLRVCADPNNLPYSNKDGSGFENALARVMARASGSELRYYWWPQRRGFLRETLDARRCDVVMGLPAALRRVRTTMPYYTSSYVFVTRRGEQPALESFDDPRLATLRIGLHTVGDDYANVPPAQALARRGLTSHIVGFPVYGDYSSDAPSRALIDAVANGTVDVAIAWGPIAGYFAAREPVALDVSELRQTDAADGTMRFAVAMGVRADDVQRAHRIDEFLDAHRHEITALLDRYGVPRVAEPPGGGAP